LLTKVCLLQAESILRGKGSELPCGGRDLERSNSGLGHFSESGERCDASVASGGVRNRCYRDVLGIVGRKDPGEAVDKVAAVPALAVRLLGGARFARDPVARYCDDVV